MQMYVISQYPSLQGIIQSREREQVICIYTSLHPAAHGVPMTAYVDAVLLDRPHITLEENRVTEPKVLLVLEPFKLCLHATVRAYYGDRGHPRINLNREVELLASPDDRSEEALDV